MRRDDWWRRDFYPPAPEPIPVDDGIRATSRRGDFGQHWWAQRWLEVLHSFDVGSRLQRGANYARRGQVSEIKVEPGAVTAQVQGSDPVPYEVSIKLPCLLPKAAQQLGQAVSENALVAAQLAAGELPQELEQLCQQLGYSLFPQRSNDLVTQCSCPDWSNPCKHVAAVCYLLAEELDRDPFLLLRLRGVERQDLLQAPEEAAATPPQQKPVRRRSRRAAGTLPAAEEPARKPLVEDLERFWHGQGTVAVAGAPPEVPIEAPLLLRLGNPPFWRGQDGLRETLQPLYREAGRAGARLAMEEADESAGAGLGW